MELIYNYGDKIVIDNYEIMQPGKRKIYTIKGWIRDRVPVSKELDQMVSTNICLSVPSIWAERKTTKKNASGLPAMHGGTIQICYSCKLSSIRGAKEKWTQARIRLGLPIEQQIIITEDI